MPLAGNAAESATMVICQFRDPWRSRSHLYTWGKVYATQRIPGHSLQSGLGHELKFADLFFAGKRRNPSRRAVKSNRASCAQAARLRLQSWRQMQNPGLPLWCVPPLPHPSPSLPTKIGRVLACKFNCRTHALIGMCEPVSACACGRPWSEPVLPAWACVIEYWGLEGRL